MGSADGRAKSRERSRRSPKASLARLLTRELVYTAVTQAQQKVDAVESKAEVRAAIGRGAAQATALRRRLQVEPPNT